MLDEIQSQVKINEAREAIREQCRRHLVRFIKEAWHVLEPTNPYQHGWHIDAIAEHLTAVSRGEIRNLLINMPPRHAKSLLVGVFWPAWSWVSDPSKRWLFSSYAQSLSIRDSVKCRRLIQSPWYQDFFSDSFRLTSDQNEKIRFENDKTGYRISTSVGGAATGEGGDVIVCDDPHNVVESESTTARKAAIFWWDQSMSTRGNDPKKFARVVVMQRVHEDDLSGHLLIQGGYEHLCLPAEFSGKKCVTSIGWEDPRNNVGELLWPERFGETQLQERKRSLGSRGYAGQFLQTPSPEEGSIIKRSWIRFYTELPDDLEHQIQSWDLAFKGEATSDFVVGQVWGSKGADCYFIDQVRSRMDFPETIAAFRRFAFKHKNATTKLVEEKANGAALIASLKREITGIIPVNPDKAKDVRTHAVAPLFEAGNVWLPHPSNAPWIGEYIEELVNFPAAKNDDQVDATTQALTRLQLNASGDWTDKLNTDHDTMTSEITSENAW